MFESKFVAPAAAAAPLLRRLEHACAADGEHPDDEIHSVYFDSPRGDAVAEVDNGDYHKDKVRVRWYGGGDSPAFVELKQKIGSRRNKVRVPVPELRRDLPLHHPAWLIVPTRLRAAGAAPPAGLLQPTLHICYRRHRFVDAATGARLALDREIRAVDVHPRFARLAALARRPTPWCVFELKAASRHLPVNLRFVIELGARRQAFSKYGLWNEFL